jgi:hypothetical protein
MHQSTNRWNINTLSIGSDESEHNSKLRNRQEEVTRENSVSLANEMRRIIMGEGTKIFYIYNTSSGTEYALFLLYCFAASHSFVVTIHRDWIMRL